MTITKERAIEILNAIAGSGESELRFYDGALSMLNALIAERAFDFSDAPKPAGVMTRARAWDAIRAAYGSAIEERAVRRDVVLGALDALDRAGAFPSDATMAEIDAVAGSILRAENRLADSDTGLWALRLASACRDAGLLKATGALV